MDLTGDCIAFSGGRKEEGILRSFGRTEVAEAIEDNLLQYTRLHARMETADLYEGSDMIRLIVPGAPDPFLNGVWRARLAKDNLDERVNETLSLFRAKHVPMLWWMDSATSPSNLDQHLLCGGLSLVRQSAMAIDLQSMDGRDRGGGRVTIRRVEDVASFRDWMQVSRDAFSFPESVVRMLSALFLEMGFEADASLRHYVGYLGRQPVTSSSAFLGAGVAGIYNVATIPQKRRQGLGTAITAFPLFEARASGYRIGVLIASEMGFGVYRRMGFRECFETRAFLLPDDRSGR